MTGYHGTCDNDGVTAALHPLIAAARAAADADPDLHNGFNDCDDADCVRCNAGLALLDRMIPGGLPTAATVITPGGQAMSEVEHDQWMNWLAGLDSAESARLRAYRDQLMAIPALVKS